MVVGPRLGVRRNLPILLLLLLLPYDYDDDYDYDYHYDYEYHYHHHYHDHHDYDFYHHHHHQLVTLDQWLLISEHQETRVEGQSRPCPDAVPN